MSIKLSILYGAILLSCSCARVWGADGDTQPAVAEGTAATATATGAQPAPAAQQPGHSHQGEAFDEGPRQQAYLIGGTGAVHFPVSTSSELAQQFFDQGVGQLHGFWTYEAERSFRQVVSLDP
ncbi:MAG: hypothetical protein AB7U73_11955, partial [Pirellulales bacterium]